jgi:hypothetical protein
MLDVCVCAGRFGSYHVHVSVEIVPQTKVVAVVAKVNNGIDGAGAVCVVCCALCLFFFLPKSLFSWL